MLCTRILRLQRAAAGNEEGREPGDVSPPTTGPALGLRFSLSASSRQLCCIAYSCSRVSGSEAVNRCSSSDFIHSWYLQGQTDGLQQAGLIQKHGSDTEEMDGRKENPTGLTQGSEKTQRKDYNCS